MFFNSPTDVVEKHVAPGTRIRLGGLVKPGSVVRGDNLAVRFEVTDGKKAIAVAYQGILPDLFREGQGVVTEGALDAGRPVQGRHRARQARREPTCRRRWPTRSRSRATGRTITEKKAGAGARRGECAVPDDRRARPLRAGAGARPGAGPGDVPIWGARTGDPVLMGVAVPTALAQFAFVALAFAALVRLLRHVRLLGPQRVRELAFGDAADLQDHQRVGKPRRLDAAVGPDPRRCSARWWRLFGGNLPATLKANVLAVQAWIAAAFYLFILVTSNPFLRLAQAPLEGRDLNPILQDIGLAVHPPMLYLGYVGFSISFSFAIAALIEGRIDAAWARWVRPWTLLAWMCLTLGIAMGSYWAYYELGWGGWWFWDPVENASLMPWLAGTALLHSAVGDGEARTR